jgi:hypothetical protein
VHPARHRARDEYAAMHLRNRQRAAIQKSRSDHHSCLSAASRPQKRHRAAPRNTDDKQSILSFNVGHNFRAFEFILILPHGFVSVILPYSFTLP